jgi:hypothetical protein
MASVEYRSDKEFIKIGVVDTGIGIKKELIDNILQPFYQEFFRSFYGKRVYFKKNKCKI